MITNHILCMFFAIMAIYFKDVTYINNNTYIIEPIVFTNLRSENHYTTNINKICPGELINNLSP